MKAVVIIGAGARGNKVFANLIAHHDTGFVLSGVVDVDERKRRAFQREHGIPDERAFTSTAELVAAPRVGDVAFICTPDPTHYELCKAVSGKGYDVLLEKPIATSFPECLELLEVEKTGENEIFVAHVLRYSPFFRKIKEIIDSGELGAVRHIDLSEDIGYWHYAHSYVRGNWRRADETAPIILTKSCHDLDIIDWLMPKRVEAVSSHGALTYFTPENAPEGAADRCVECRYEDDCLYSASRFYVNDQEGWPYDVIAPLEDTVEARAKAIAEGPYGRCVWHSDNNVCDHQTVSLQFASGALASFGLHAQTADVTRKIRILFDDAELNGDLHKNELTVSRFTGENDVLHIPETRSSAAAPEHHGGGDVRLLYALYQHLTTGEHSALISSLRNSLMSHVLAFLAEESRLDGNRMIQVPDPLLPPGSAPPNRTPPERSAALSAEGAE